MIYIFLIVKVVFKIFNRISQSLGSCYTKGCLMFYNADFNPRTLYVLGWPKIIISHKGNLKIGKGVHLHSGLNNGIDCTSKLKINVKKNAKLHIGDCTGLTNVVIQCHKEILIGNNVNIGAGTMIYDTDFHSLDWKDRLEGVDIAKRRKKKVVIKDLAFIGAHCIILKGVTVGEKSIIGAGSIVTADIPDGEIWAGNPARFIRKIDNNNL